MIASRFGFYAKMVISILMFGAGLFFILSPNTFPLLETKYTIAIGVIFIARGIFRAYAAYKYEFKQEN